MKLSEELAVDAPWATDGVLHRHNLGYAALLHGGPLHGKRTTSGQSTYTMSDHGRVGYYAIREAADGVCYAHEHCEDDVVVVRYDFDWLGFK